MAVGRRLSSLFGFSFLSSRVMMKHRVSKESEFLKRERTCWPLGVSEYEVRDVGW